MLVNGTKIFFRGRAILNGIIEMLLKGHGMDAATDVVLAGTSAGGLAVILTADHVGSVLPSTIKFRALPGAGLFMSGVKNINGVLAYQKNYAWVFKAQNASGGVNQNCIPSTPSGYEFRCFLAPYALPYVSTPMYLINALQDRWQAINILGTTCNPTVAGNCTAAELTALSGLRSAMIDAVTQPILNNPANGAFLPNCWTHCLEDTDMGLHKLTVGGKTMAEGILQFLATGNGTLASAVDGTTLNPSCPAAFCGAA
jgi:O-palmitoleoyl-L-serine hydrolase